MEDSQRSLIDPKWPSLAEPVRLYLAEPRTWAEINAWIKEAKVSPYLIRNAIAWLEANYKIKSYYREDGKLVWRQGARHARSST